MEERLTSNQDVAGSRPARSEKFFLFLFSFQKALASLNDVISFSLFYCFMPGFLFLIFHLSHLFVCFVFFSFPFFFLFRFFCCVRFSTKMRAKWRKKRMRRLKRKRRKMRNRSK